jgi:hypothetical protein
VANCLVVPVGGGGATVVAGGTVVVWATVLGIELEVIDGLEGPDPALASQMASAAMAEAVTAARGHQRRIGRDLSTLVDRVGPDEVAVLASAQRPRLAATAPRLEQSCYAVRNDRRRGSDGRSAADLILWPAVRGWPPVPTMPRLGSPRGQGNAGGDGCIASRVA